MIEVRELSKTYRDRRKALLHAVEGASFRCEPGRVFGLIGPNGAGKTTALRIISTALRPTSGHAVVAGFDTQREPARVRASIGFLTANVGLYGRLTPREVLRFFGELHGMSRPDIASRTSELSRAFQMDDFLDRACDKLSLGMRQKTNIARSLIHSPPVIILDEPTAGLDVLTSRGIVEFIRESRAEGKTVLLSTHIMSEVERLCDGLAIIHEGRIRFRGTVEELKQRHGADLEDAFVGALGDEPC